MRMGTRIGALVKVGTPLDSRRRIANLEREVLRQLLEPVIGRQRAKTVGAISSLGTRSGIECNTSISSSSSIGSGIEFFRGSR